VKPLETLRALGTGGEAPSDAKQRVYGALMTSLATAAAAGTAVAAAANTAAAAAAKSAVLTPAPVPLLAGLTSAKALAVAAGIWLIGGATGAALFGALHPQEVRVVYVERPVLSNAVVTPGAALTPSASASASIAPSSSALASPEKRAPAASVNSASDLSRERALLDLARANAARGEPALVLKQTEQHRAQFPRGKLGEEREALAIRALLSLGRTAEARARAQAFHLAHPDSFLTPMIDSALSVP
jgi:hypothetical protein